MSDLAVRVIASGVPAAGESASHIGYRAYIDGLRAVAVVPVVLCHAGFTTMSGGFVGVDVFFVISGFLITSLIVSDLDAGTFSLVGFYERRVRRILPALFAVIALCSVAAWFVFMPVEFAYFARSVIAAVMFCSNVLFWQESGYFDAAAQVKPLLHTWSLAVEEQFYIFFPLLLMFLHKMRRAHLPAALGGIAAVSFALNVWLTYDEPEFAFFMSPPRFWELLLGAFLALGVVPNVASRLSNELLAALGLALILGAVLTYSETMNFPGFAALAPAVGAALIIYSGHQSGVIARLLSSRAFVFLGLISYSLYLWHWPLFVFVRYYFGRDLATNEALGLIALSFGIAVLSWRWIEQPFRRKQRPVPRPRLFRLAGAAMAAAAGFGLYVNASGGLASRLPPEAALAYAAKMDFYASRHDECFGGKFEDIQPAGGCPQRLGEAPGQPLQYLVWGDSHAGAMTPAIVKAAGAGRPGLLIGSGSCPPLLDFDTGASKREKLSRCQRSNRATLDLISDQHIPLVFMVARWPKYVHRSEYGKEGVFFDPSEPLELEDYSAELRTALDATLSELVRRGSKVVLVMDVPEIGYDVPHALAKAVMTRSSGDIAPTPEAVQRRQELAKKVLAAAAQRSGAIILDPTPEICDPSRCYVRKNGVILYIDEDHLTVSGAREISRIFDPVFSVVARIVTQRP
jgi:peptidoglycan/LPS O-acetylase OafA/YrhL